MGVRSQAAPRTGPTNVRAQRKGFCTAAVFGVISQKIRTTRESRRVAMSSPQVSENLKERTVAILEATMVATLLTIRIVERNLFGLARSCSISTAFLSPSSTRFFSLIRLTEVKAVSEAEAIVH